MSRARTLERLEAETFDLVVIGAGIIGARVAYEAAVAGAAVALIDAHDFGAATSSASSKLVHGGLRYLQMHDFRLVLATVTAAARAGVAVLNHARVTGVGALDGFHAVRLGDLVVRGRAVINAAGPWVDEVRRLEDPNVEPMARLSKGVHVV